jgi:membrane protease YdiL (CAAX protease family)
MFESKTWYKEVAILIVIPRILSVVSAFLIPQNHNGNYDYTLIITGLIIISVFIGLATWRILKRKVTIKEVIVLILLDTALGIGSSFLLPYYLSPLLSLVLLYIIIFRIHASAEKKISNQG